MTTRELYYHLDHMHRFARWQTERAIEHNRQLAIARRNVRLAAQIHRERVKDIARANASWYAGVMTDAYSQIR